MSSEAPEYWERGKHILAQNSDQVAVQLGELIWESCGILAVVRKKGRWWFVNCFGDDELEISSSLFKTVDGIIQRKTAALS